MLTPATDLTRASDGLPLAVRIACVHDNVSLLQKVEHNVQLLALVGVREEPKSIGRSLASTGVASRK